MDYIFVLTFGVVILNLLFIMTLFGKVPLSLPKSKYLSPTYWWVFYPSFFYQVWWWSKFIGLI